jgi:hypothetical protein
MKLLAADVAKAGGGRFVQEEDRQRSQSRRPLKSAIIHPAQLRNTSESNGSNERPPDVTGRLRWSRRHSLSGLASLSSDIDAKDSKFAPKITQKLRVFAACDAAHIIDKQ